MNNKRKIPIHLIIELCIGVLIAVGGIIGVLVVISKPVEYKGPSQTHAPTSTSQAAKLYPAADTSVSFEEIYHEFELNKLRAESNYKNNRYRVTAKINGMETGGLLNLTGGATLTMEIEIDGKTLFFLAEFEKDQEEALKDVNVGDTITFDGKCLSAGSWTECSIVE